MPSISISTVWPGASVYSSGGTSPVPVSSTEPGGTGLSRTTHSASSCGDRFIRAVDVSPANSSAPAASTIRIRIGNGPFNPSGQSSGTASTGPIAQAPAKILACGM